MQRMEQEISQNNYQSHVTRIGSTKLGRLVWVITFAGGQMVIFQRENE
jgi:hypothetical protein